MVIALLAQVADTPAGKPFAPGTPALAIPVAPVVVLTIGVNAVPIHNGGTVVAVETVLFVNTVNTAVVDTRGVVSGVAQPVTVPEINTR